MPREVVLLWSSISTESTNTRRLQHLLATKKMSVNSVDGALPENKDMRDKLFELSQKRGRYPQVFIRTGDETYEFAGLWDDIESLLDCDSLPAEFLEANPSIRTFSKEEMSEAAVKEENRRGPRRFRGHRRGPGGKQGGEKRDSGERRRESQPRQPRVESAPVPPELIGKTVTGKICDIIKRGKGQFGFIYIGDGTTPRDETPRIYFSFNEFSDDNFVPRKGYTVEFTCAEDAEKRAYASDVKLTVDGRKQAEDREETLKSSGAPERQPRERGGESRAGHRQRKDEEDDRSVTLKVTCEGNAEEKFVVARVTQSIGKLKHTATKEFDAPVEYNVFYNVSNENPGGILLTRAALIELKDNDTIHLRPAEEESK